MINTSAAAHAAIAPMVPSIMEEVLTALSLEPATTPELVALTGISAAALQPRTTELRKKGSIMDSGKRRMNPETGKKVIVWSLVN